MTPFARTRHTRYVQLWTLSTNPRALAAGRLRNRRTWLEPQWAKHCHCFRSCLQLSASNSRAHVPSSVDCQLDLSNHAPDRSIFDQGTRLGEIVHVLALEPPTLAGCVCRDPKRIGNLIRDLMAFCAPLAMHLPWRRGWRNRWVPCQPLGSTLARGSASPAHLHIARAVSVRFVRATVTR